MDPEYIHLPPDCSPPDVTGSAFRAVVVIEAAVSTDWRAQVSAWLVKSNCLYMMAWGQECSLWDDSVDYANLDEFEYGDIPDDRFVMTTWHEAEELHDVLWFCEHTARHPAIDLDRTILVHVSPNDRKSELLAEYERVR